MKDSEVVAKARELISDEESWTKGRWCISAPGVPGGLMMCAEGAVRNALGLYRPVGEFWELTSTESDEFYQARRIELELTDVAGELLFHVLDRLAEYEVEEPMLSDFNDSEVTRHEDVLAIFDRTYENMIQEGR